ncbi:4-hydroxy-tetrahydrodipicolinate reductase [soil metagenome]
MKIALIGYGKMGKAIEEIALEKGHEIVLKITSRNQEDFTASNLKKADIAIEFTSPETAVTNILCCIAAGIPVVCGTTGWLSKLVEVTNAIKNSHSAFLYASNFSIGVNIFFELNKKLSQLMSRQSDYDVSIEEIHHTQKKDAPSGTAITLAQQILDQIKTKSKWVNQKAGAPEELAIISKRIDPAPGTHSVKYTSQVDDLTITHTAHNRIGFASGAVLAAEFVFGKSGIYSMKDVLGI